VRKDGTTFIARVVVTPRLDSTGKPLGLLLMSKDISDELRLNRELEATQFYTRSLIESNVDALMTTDSLGVITDVNEEMARLTGVERDELIGSPFKTYFTDPERAEDGIRLVLRDGKVTNYELTARAADGRETVVSYNASTFFDRDGKLEGVFAAARDITEQKTLEQQLRETQAYNRGLIESSVDGLITVDPAGLISDVNERMCMLSGYPREELIGTAFADYFLDADRASAGVHQKLLAEARRWEEAERELAARARQDAALADLSRRALDGLSGTELLEAACEAVRDELAVDFVEVLELESFEMSLRVTAGIGWRAGVLGETVVEARPGSLGWRTLHEPDVMEITAHPSVPRLPQRLAEHGVAAGIRVAVHDAGRELGILGAYTVARRSFTAGERAFLRSAANVVGTAVVRVEARGEVARRERELRAIFDGARDALAVTDYELRCVRVNDAACELFGRPRNELIGMTAAEIVAPESYQELAAGWAAALREGGAEGTVTILRPDGVRRIAEYSGTMEIVSGFHLVSLRDVTERIETTKALERTLHEAAAVEQRYVDLIETLPDAIVAVDEDGRIALVNVQTERMFGYDRSELVGQRLEQLLPARHRETHEAHRAHFGPSSRSRAMGLGLDLQGLRKDGTEFPVEVSLRAVRVGDGQLVTSVVTDVTERRALEQKLQQAQRLEAVGRLAGGVAHDFNNVLQVIEGYAASLQERAAPGRDTEELAEVVAAAERAASLTRQLLAFSRRQVLQPVVLDLNAIVIETKRLLARMIGEDVEMAIELDDALPHVRADRGQIEQVLANLVVNARDAMPGGGRVSIETHPYDLVGAPHEPALPKGTYVRLRVTDTGLGMDAETAARAFDPFFTTKGEGHGTGLGLATVHGIVTQSGGHVSILSAPGEGTTICILLPAVGDPLDEPDGKHSAQPARGTGERVLLVEDEPVVRRLVASLLERLGYAVTSTADGAAALAAALEAPAPFDLLVTDFVLPDLSGPEVAGCLVASDAVPAVLYISGYAPDTHVAVAGGRSGFLQKPFTNDELARHVRELLDGGGETS
jgi:PAS domain S-box-containing protein